MGCNLARDDIFVCHRYVTLLVREPQSSRMSSVLFMLVNYSAQHSTRPLSGAATFLTVITNIIVTILITSRLLRARQKFSKLLPSSDGKQVYTGMIAIIIESAAPLTIFGIIVAALRESGIPLLDASPGFVACTALFDGLFYLFCVSLHRVF